MQAEKLKNLLHSFRMIGIAEGISFLILLLVAMPLKYFFNFPMAVKIFGWAHGALFIGYLFFAFRVFETFKKTIGWFAISFVAALLPFGTFVTDRILKKEEEAL